MIDNIPWRPVKDFYLAFMRYGLPRKYLYFSLQIPDYIITFHFTPAPHLLVMQSPWLENPLFPWRGFLVPKAP